MYYSHVALLEIALKVGDGRAGSVGLPVSSQAAIAEFEKAGFEPLAITPRHIDRLEALSREHGDPFDRLFLAQALSEPMRLVTHDRKLATFSDTVILV